MKKRLEIDRRASDFLSWYVPAISEQEIVECYASASPDSVQAEPWNQFSFRCRTGSGRWLKIVFREDKDANHLVSANDIDCDAREMPAIDNEFFRQTFDQSMETAEKNLNEALRLKNRISQGETAIETEHQYCSALSLAYANFCHALHLSESEASKLRVFKRMQALETIDSRKPASSQTKQAQIDHDD